MTGASTSPATDDVLDEIIRSIRIAASAEVVWEIIREPGWFINDGEYREHDVTTEDEISRIVDPEYGEFVIATEELDPPRRAVFRWLGGEAGEIGEHPANTVEFTIEPDLESPADGASPSAPGVVLTVRERGFAGISEDAAARRRSYEENSSGWIEELALARRLAERSR